MKKALSALIVVAVLLSAVPAYAADWGSISTAVNQTSAKVGDDLTATFSIQTVYAELIAIAVHFNPNVVKIADSNGAIVSNGEKSAAAARNGTAGIVPGQALSGDVDANEDPLYWNGAFLIPPVLDNEKGMYTFYFSNTWAKQITDETLISLHFVAVGEGNADIRIAKEGDAGYTLPYQIGAAYVASDSATATGAIEVRHPSITTAPTVVIQGTGNPNPGNGISPGADGGGGGSSPTVTITPPATGSRTLTYEISEKMFANSLARAVDETGGKMIINLDFNAANVDTLIIKIHISSLRQAIELLVRDIRFETPLGDVDAIIQTLLERAKAGSAFAIFTIEKGIVTITIDGIPLAGAPNGADFADVPPEHWAYQYVMELVGMGVLNGVDEMNFKPSDNVTREQFAKMLVSALAISSEDATCDFPDVLEGTWYYPFVARAVDAGYVKGYGDGTFGVGAGITREEMALMVYRVFETMPVRYPAIEFVDSADISVWAAEAVAAMQTAGIINGMPDGSFMPSGNATRAEAAKIICVMLEL